MVLPQIQRIESVASKIGLSPEELEFYGPYKAKVSLSALERRAGEPLGRYVVVSGITPTPFGEGKTVTAIGLSQAFWRMGKTAVVCLRQPSLGPVFGVKGGATGGGKAQLFPADEINLGLTGDFHAVTSAHNLACAFLDNHLYRGNALNIDPERIFIRRVLDLCDRWALSDILIGLQGFPRKSGFDITPTSEVMAILALARDLGDLRKRLGRMVLALTKEGKPVTCEDLRVAGAMAALLREALKPNLVQTSEGTPAFVHTGPFANIAHGNSSVVADLLALRLGEFVVTEAGFGSDIGLEKFVHIKCRTSGLVPDCVVLVASIRALKVHSGKYSAKPGQPLDPRLADPDPKAVEEGCANLEKHIENVQAFGLPCVVALNRFPEDDPEEIRLVRKFVEGKGVFFAESRAFAAGGEGARELAEAVAEAASLPKNFRFLYDLFEPLPLKIERVAKIMYGADGVEFTDLAWARVEECRKLGWADLPICLAKTHLSLSHDPSRKGRPRGFILPVRDLRPMVGAGFLYALCGNISTMPGLPAHPAGERIDIDAEGNVIGLG
jgi:formate--tetrahydrofolate ligase